MFIITHLPLAANYLNNCTSKLAVSMLAVVFGFQIAANFKVYLYRLYGRCYTANLPRNVLISTIRIEFLDDVRVFVHQKGRWLVSNKKMYTEVLKGQIINVNVAYQFNEIETCTETYEYYADKCYLNQIYNVSTEITFLFVQ